LKGGAVDTIVSARIDEAVDRLADEFKGTFSPETVSRCAFESLHAFQRARLVEFIPLLTFRFTRERLLALAQAEGLVKKELPEILFVCVHNAGRSQMAAALTAALSDGRVHVRSAGSAPADEINPAVTEVMGEIELDITFE
jgi:arsenate reductase